MTDTTTRPEAKEAIMSEVITVWSHKAFTYGPGFVQVPVERRSDWGFSGMSPADEGEFVRQVEANGHAIVTGRTYGNRSWNHNVAGVGVGHDDAIFAESGRSMAAYYENGEAFGGRWWEDGAGASVKRLYGLAS